MKHSKIYNIVITALFTALISVGAFIRIPIPLVPFTIQVFFVILAGLMLGKNMGAISVLLYMGLGLSGIPIFAAGGGISYVFNPTFGYIIGFATAAYAVGLISGSKENPSYKRLFAAAFIGLFIIYLIGVIYLYLIRNIYLGNSISLWAAFIYGFVVFLPGDTVSCILAVVITKSIKPVILKRLYNQ